MPMFGKRIDAPPTLNTAPKMVGTDLKSKGMSLFAIPLTGRRTLDGRPPAVWSANHVFWKLLGWLHFVFIAGVEERLLVPTNDVH